MVRAGVLIFLGSTGLFCGTKALRTKKDQHDGSIGGNESLQSAAGPELDWDAVMANAMDWMKEQSGAAPPSFDLNGIIKQTLQPKASADGAASKNPFDVAKLMDRTEQAPAGGASPTNPFGKVMKDALGNFMKQAMKPKAPADDANPNKPFDFGNIMKQIVQAKPPAGDTASKDSPDWGKIVKQAPVPNAPEPKAPADSGAPKSSFDLGNFMKQLLKQKAAGSPATQPTKQAEATKAPQASPVPVAQPTPQITSTNPAPPAMNQAIGMKNSAPNNPLNNFIDWVKVQQKKAASSTAEAADHAAKQTATSSMNSFMKWAMDQADKATKAAGKQAAAKEAAETTLAKVEHKKGMDQVELPSIRGMTDERIDEAKQKAEEALRHLMDQAKSAAMEAAEARAAEIVEKTTQANAEARGLSKAAADSSIVQAEERIRAADSAQGADKKAAEKAAQEASQHALNDLLEWVQAEETTDQGEFTEAAEEMAGKGQFSGAAERPGKKASLDPVRDAWINALIAEKKVKTADWLAGSIDAIAGEADKAAWAGHNASKALYRQGRSSTGLALGTAKDVGDKAGLTVKRSNLLVGLARYTRARLRRAIRAAMGATSVGDFKSAWKAVVRAYGASGKVADDAREALVNSREAMSAVARSLAEVGWRAVSEVLRSEVKVLLDFASKNAIMDAGLSVAAWRKGAEQAKKVAQEAWVKGFGQGLQALAKHNVAGKVQRASGSTAKASAAWMRALANILGSQEARQAISKAAGSATSAASAATAAATKETLDMFREAPKQPWFPSIVANSKWDPKDGYKGTLAGTIAGSRFKAGIRAVPNATHDRAMIAGGIQMPNNRNVRGHAIAVLGKSKNVGTLAKGFLRQEGGGEPSAGVATSVRSEPAGRGYDHVQASNLAWGRNSYAMHGVDTMQRKDYPSVGKITAEYKTPGLTKPLKVKADFIQPVH